MPHRTMTEAWCGRPVPSTASLKDFPDRYEGSTVKTRKHLMKCTVCEDVGWVCEDHRDMPWDRLHPRCSSAGMPCPNCNLSDPRPPAGGSGSVWKMTPK